MYKFVIFFQFKCHLSFLVSITTLSSVSIKDLAVKQNKKDNLNH
jgi:hypothetical protein